MNSQLNSTPARVKGMPTFDESQHPRQATGEFTAKARSAPEQGLEESHDDTIHVAEAHAPQDVVLTYRDSAGTEYLQPVSDLVASGTLVDPETGDDMAIESVATPRAKGHATSSARYIDAVQELRFAHVRAQEAQLSHVRDEIARKAPDAVEARYVFDDEAGCVLLPFEVLDTEGNELDVDLDTNLDLFDDWTDARQSFGDVDGEVLILRL